MSDPSPASQSPIAGSFEVISPGRVNLIGEHTDYNDGLVLPMAIEPHLRFQVSAREDRVIRLCTARGGDSAAVVDLRSLVMADSFHGQWSAYLAGVIAGYQRLGWDIPGCDVSITSTLPVGGGLSSSAALEVGMATVIEALCGRELPMKDKALLCQQAEHEFAGVPCGIMDQFAVTFGKAGHLLLLDCRSQEIQQVPLRDPSVSVLVINSGVKHSLADGEYAQRRQQCESAAALLKVGSLRDVSLAQWHELQGQLPELEQRRARHVITEHVRTEEFVHALEKSDWHAAGDAMYGSHASLRDDYAVSCAELDQLVAISQEIGGVFGCRMTGGGFGGCVVALIETAAAAAIQSAFQERYSEATGIDPAMFITQAANGAHVFR
jgi:galactokinase